MSLRDPSSGWLTAPPDDVLERARQILIIVAVLVIGPFIAAIAWPFRMTSDWTIPLFSLVPPRLSVPLRAVARAAVILLVLEVGALMAAPRLATVKVLFEPN